MSGVVLGVVVPPAVIVFPGDLPGLQLLGLLRPGGQDTGGSLPAGTGRKGAEMGCKVKNEGRRTIITKNGGNFMEKYIFDEGNGLWYELQRD